MVAAANMWQVIVKGVRESARRSVEEVSHDRSGSLNRRIDIHGLIEGAREHEMRLGDSLVLRVEPGSDVRLPDPPGRWFGRTRELHVATGSVFASTGGRPLGFELVVTTRDAHTRVTGTTFAVRRNDHGTCVCLYEGSVEVEQRAREEVVRVPTGRRVQVYSDGHEPAIEPLDEGEVAVLEGLYDTI